MANLEAMEKIRAQHAELLEGNGHVLATNRIDNDDTAAFYCGACGHGWAVKDTGEKIGKDFDAECAPPVVDENEVDNG
jgi:hypothetical protein